MKARDVTLRLAVSFCLLAAVLLVVGWQGIHHLRQINAQMQNIVAKEWGKLQLAHEALRISDQNRQITLLVCILDDQDQIKQQLDQRAINTDRISKLVSEIEPQLELGTEKELFDVVKSTRTPYLDSYQRALSLLLTGQKPEEARKMMVDVVRPKLLAYHTAWTNFDQYEADKIDQVIKQSKADYIADQREFAFTLVLAGLVTGTIAIFTVVHMGREVAARQRTEQSLQQEHDLLEQRVKERTAQLASTNEMLGLLSSAVEYARESILITDAELDLPGPKIIFVNSAFTKMTGYTAEEVIGKTPRMLQGPRTDRAVLDRLRKNLEQGRDFAGEAINYRKDGTEFDLEWQIGPIRDSSGKITHFVAVQHDVTDRKRIEARMFQSQKMETVGKLAGGVAHEFNSILTAIIGQSELLLNDLPLEGTLGKSASEIHRAAERASVLTRQLLAYGRKQILQPEILDLNQVLADMSGTLQHVMGREMDLRIIPVLDLKPVKIDRGQMEQVIVNIAENASDAMPNGGKLILETANVTLDEEYVRPFPGLKPGNYVMLAITDTGSGMSDEVKARIFEPFFSTKSAGQGTGLGLATCYGIVKQSEGHISVYSEIARGASFKIYLPQVDQPTKSCLLRLASPDLPGGTETILLAEDNASLREMSSTFLRRLGYTVLTAVNGIEALNLKNQKDIGRIDLLFTDIVMPHMSGKELSDRIRAIYPRTKILFTSAYTENSVVLQGLLKEGVALLQKPFTPTAMAHKVREVLDQ